MTVRYSVKTEGHENMLFVNMPAEDACANASRLTPAVKFEDLMAIFLSERKIS